jgi:hypothetical protein
MSRYIVKLEGQKEFIYGWDHALGYFYELWDNSISDEEELCILFEKSSVFDNMTKVEMLEQMEKYGVEESHIELVAVDLPF